jgi:putative membrane protein
MPLHHENSGPLNHAKASAARVRGAVQWGGATAFCLVAGAAALAIAPFDPLARHMAAHILLMNAVAPALALMVRAIAPGGASVLASGRSGSLVIAALAQAALLWAWHAPAALAATVTVPGMHLFMQLSLFVAALWFWLEIFSDRGAFRWRALLALLLTGKMFCLLGMLLVFAPRALYPVHGSAHGVAGTVSALADQHLAGLLMLIACPLTYVLAGVVIASQGLHDLSSASAGQQAIPASSQISVS